MRHPLFILCLFASFASGPPAVAAERIACAGPFGPAATHESLAAAFGAANVTYEEEVAGAEGEIAGATVLFANDPNRRLEVFWWDAEKRNRIASVTLGEGGAWVFGDGPAPGQSLADLQVLNGKAFTLNGFFWDYGGTVIDWNGGALGKVPGGCSLMVTLEPDESAPQAALDAVSGDVQLPSSDPKMKAVSPKVQRVTFGYPE
jgi:hypothetical protein